MSSSEKLHFPTFHHELLSQSYWNAGDDLGRMKVVISEGRSGQDIGFEVMKNIVSFSFQHAPLAIAWPNPAMFRRPQPAVSTGPIEGRGGHFRHHGSMDHQNVVAKEYDPFTEPSRWKEESA
ncbi:hypothetical protein D0Z07_2359 [Hyphodiscus hymeniophilus]|uniref:Uncharacterized protein n=1 Tax=Hyphodiscus hymeniophilus TaxID=353542 RepID=A0A9P6VPC2_9HELO|nr:hypothetical protein D0Z07_2359 [Hyphodiscus hymeniophilus]